MGRKMIRWKGLIKGVTAAMLAVVTAMSPIPGTDFVLNAYAAGDKTITGLCTGTIGNPTESAGGWSYVYYGKHDNNAMKYRVLDTAATEFGGSTMLLDCNSTIASKRFDDNSNVWADSEIKTWLNGSDFYKNTDVFTSQEKAAIASSTKSSAANGDGNGWSELGFATLNGEYIFLLDAKEATRPSYGYPNTSSNSDYRKKEGADTWWWLRSPYSNGDEYAGSVTYYGIIYYKYVGNNMGVSPAFNLNRESVIFSSEVTGGYKLTVKDTDMTIEQTTGSDVTRDGNVVTVPYTISGSNSGKATRVSVLITDEPYSAGKAITSGYSYLKLNVNSFGTSGTGTFTLPSAYADKTCGTNYYAYILAEDVNGDTETDYASVPVSITIPGKKSGGGDESKDDSGNSLNNNTPNDEETIDYLDELRDKLETAISLGTEQTVTWDKGTALPYDIMKKLQDNPKITLVFSYTYQNVDFKVTLSGKNVKAYTTIPWYGPLYLYTYYGGRGTVKNASKVNTANGTYTVVDGDTLTGIAIKLNTSVKSLVSLNNIKDPDKLKIGQVLRY